MSDEFHDYIIIGAGLAGLAIAALLARDGYRVKLLEAHTVSGGCASYFKRKDFIFDVGATTLSGLQSSQPLGKLIKELDLQNLNFKKMDIAMKIFQNGKTINRYADIELWIEEVIKQFCSDKDLEEADNMKKFWLKLHNMEQDAWSLLELHPNLLPVNFKDLLQIISPHKLIANLQALAYVPSLFTALEKSLKDSNLSHKEDFIEFINEQLIISTQSHVDKSPELMGALGLNYASDMYYPYGGIHTLSKALEEKFLEHGGEIIFKSEVNSIESIEMDKEKIYFLKDKQGREFLTENVISNLPVWNMLKISHDTVHDFFKPYADKFTYNTSAFMLYFAVKTDEDFGTSYLQMICPEIIPNCSSKSFFVTISQIDDEAKASQGWRTVTISSHTDADFWLNLNTETYKQKKNETQNYIFQELFKNIPSLQQAEKEFISSSSSKSFEFFTKRKNGLVGGLPHSIDQPFYTLMPKKVPKENIYMVGDTVFPGQGLVATAYSALSLYATLKLPPLVVSQKSLRKNDP